MDEKFLKKADKLARLIVAAKCEACGNQQEIPYEKSTVEKLLIADVLFENFQVLTVDEVDLLLCALCKNSTSLTDLRAIAGRVRREAEKNAR